MALKYRKRDWWRVMKWRSYQKVKQPVWRKREDVVKLSKAGVRPEPDWLKACTAVPPLPPPIIKTKKPPIQLKYPEDLLRKKFFQVYPETKNRAINARAQNMMNRHISDKFVYNQIQLMKKGMTETHAFKTVQSKFENDLKMTSGSEADLFSRLMNPRISNYYARVFLASWTDSTRDKYLYKNFSGRSPRGLEITLDDILKPEFLYADDGESESSDVDPENLKNGESTDEATSSEEEGTDNDPKGEAN